MRTREAIVLFAHGARDARWSQSLLALAEALRRHTQADVRVAFLELQPPDLPEALEQAAAAGAESIRLAPVFWAGAGHIESDLPALLEAFRRRQPQVSVQVLPVLSELPGMLDFIARALIEHP